MYARSQPFAVCISLSLKQSPSELSWLNCTPVLEAGRWASDLHREWGAAGRALPPQHIKGWEVTEHQARSGLFTHQPAPEAGDACTFVLRPLLSDVGLGDNVGWGSSFSPYSLLSMMRSVWTPDLVRSQQRGPAGSILQWHTGTGRKNATKSRMPIRKNEESWPARLQASSRTFPAVPGRAVNKFKGHPGPKGSLAFDLCLGRRRE